MVYYTSMEKPWMKHLYDARRRARDKGRECTITPKEIESLWILDGAVRLKRPSLDRIEGTKGYSFKNCRFIEFNENASGNDRLSTPNTLHSIQPSDTLEIVRRLVDTLANENPEKIYSRMDIEEMRLMPWAKNGRTICKFIDADIVGKNILDAAVTGEGGRRRYQIKAKNLIKFLEQYGQLLLEFARKPQRYYGKKERNNNGRDQRSAVARKASKHLRGIKCLPRRAEADGKNRSR